MSSIAQHEQHVEGDVVRTIAGVARVLGLSERAAYRSLRSVRKIGNRYFASRSRLLEEVTGSSD